MKHLLLCVCLTLIFASGYVVGARLQARQSTDDAYADGYRWGSYQRALYDQRMNAAERGSTRPVPGMEAEAQRWDMARATPPATSYLPPAQ